MGLKRIIDKFKNRKILKSEELKKQIKKTVEEEMYRKERIERNAENEGYTFPRNLVIKRDLNRLRNCQRRMLTVSITIEDGNVDKRDLKEEISQICEKIREAYR